MPKVDPYDRARRDAGRVGWSGQWSTVQKASDTTPQTQQGTFSELVELVVDGLKCRTKDGPAVIGATFKNGVRLDENVEQSTMLGYDLDGTPQNEVKQLVDRLDDEGVAALLTSTWSDGVKEPDKLRCRLFIPLDLPVDAGFHRPLWRRVHDDLIDCTGSDKSCLNPSRLWYTLRRNPKGREPRIKVIAGDALDPVPILQTLEPDDAGQVDDKPIEIGDLPEKVKCLLEDDQRLNDLLHGRGKKEGDTSGSGYDFSFTLALIEKGVKDPDDLASALARRTKKGARYVRRTVKRALKTSKRRIFKRGSEAELAVALLDDLTVEDVKPVATESDLFAYDDERGLWIVNTDDALRSHVAAWDGRWVGTTKKGKPLKVSLGMARGSVSLARSQVADPRFFEDAPRALIFADAALVIEGEEVVRKPLSPELRGRHGFPFDLPTPDTKGELFRFYRETVLHGASDADERLSLLAEFTGAAAFGLAPQFGRALLLYGPKGSGKSTFLRISEALFPPHVRCSVPPSELHSEYWRAQLAGKRLNVIYEMPESDILKDAHWKAIVHGERTAAARKYGHPFDFYPESAHLFAGNALPSAPGVGAAWWDRWMVVELPRRIRGTVDDIPYLGQRIGREDLPAVVAWMVEGVKRLLARGQYIIPTSSAKLLSRWRREADPVAAFLEDCTTPLRDVSAHTWPRAKELYAAYKTWCGETGHRSCSLTKFGRRVADQGIERKRSDGTRFGISLRANWRGRVGLGEEDVF